MALLAAGAPPRRDRVWITEVEREGNKELPTNTYKTQR